MANFHTHLSVALIITAPVATAGFMRGLYGFFELILLTVVGAVGGLLPDIDLDNSKISQIAFTTASLFGASFLTFLYASHQPLTLVGGLVLWASLVLGFKFIVFGLFSKFTKHRGMVHSVPYMAMLSLLFILLCYHQFKMSDLLSWVFGLFLFLGSLVHLILDEIYSVNVLGLKVKKSFGTAFKFFEFSRPLPYLFLYAFLLGLFVFSPPQKALLESLKPFIHSTQTSNSSTSF